MNADKLTNLAAIATSAIRQEENLRGQGLYTPELVQTTINLMVISVKRARPPKQGGSYFINCC